MKITSLAALFAFGAVGCMTEVPPGDSVDLSSSEEALSTQTSVRESPGVSRTADRRASEGQKSSNEACTGDPGSCVIPAAVDDGFVVPTTDGCGRADFIDFGPGVPGGADNDDYVEIHDFCADGHGVRAFATLSGIDLGSMYNGNGLAGASVIWDPFKAFGNVFPGDTVVLKACLVDGPNDTTPFNCRTISRTSVDG